VAPRKVLVLLGQGGSSNLHMAITSLETWDKTVPSFQGCQKHTHTIDPLDWPWKYSASVSKHKR